MGVADATGVALIASKVRIHTDVSCGDLSPEVNIPGTFDTRGFLC